MQDTRSLFVERIIVLCKRIKYACRNLTVHGPSFLVRNDIHIAYRIIYFVIYIHICAAAFSTILRYSTHYQDNTIRFTTRTDYLYWNTTFPSITVCEVSNIEKLWTQKEKLKENSKDVVDHFIKDIAFFSGTCHSCMSTCEDNPVCMLNYTTIKTTFRADCKDMFTSCSWNGKPINCCNDFKTVETEYGICYSINSLHALDTPPLYRVTSSNRNKRDTLEIVLRNDYEAFVHAPEDIPFWNMEYDRRIAAVYGSRASVIFSITDIINAPEVYLTSPEERQCRFTEEVPDDYLAYNKYSYSVCITECRIKAQLDLCNCTHHLSPLNYKDKYCDLEGLKCLTRNFKTLTELKVPETNRSGLDCNCVPSCTEPDYNVISKKITVPQKDVKTGSIKFILSNRPYERISRQIAKTPLDLVVAIGNCFGLYFGGSILSVVEIIYYLCFKKWKYDKDSFRNISK
jgi:acid-sensing ion channel, other